MSRHDVSLTQSSNPDLNRALLVRVRELEGRAQRAEAEVARLNIRLGHTEAALTDLLDRLIAFERGVRT